MKWERRGQHSASGKCYVCEFVVDPGEGTVLKPSTSVWVFFHERCLRRLADAATGPEPITCEQVAPGVFGVRGPGPAVPPKQEVQQKSGELPKHAKIPPRRKPGR